MPVVARIKGFVLFFYSQESGEPPHIHVRYQDGLAKFWISPVKLAKNQGMKASELGKLEKIVI